MQCKYTAPIRSQNLSCSDGDHLLVNVNYLDLIKNIPNLSFTSIYKNKHGEIVKELENSSVIKIQIPDKKETANQVKFDPKKPEYFYLKKHNQQFSLLTKLISLLQINKREPEGIEEYNNYCLFREKGLATAIPIAAGQKSLSFFKTESFLITKSYTPLFDLEDIVLHSPEQLSGSNNQSKRRTLLKSIGQYARKMHTFGLNHKDFNATHILIDDIEAKEQIIALFDLQRVDKNKIKRFKWPIKAMAELNFTLSSQVFSEDDRRFLFLSYLGREKFSLKNKIQWQWIKKKTARIDKHCRKRGLAPKMEKD